MAKKKADKKPRGNKYASGVEERIKSLQNISLPDENPEKLENERKIDRWRPAFRNDRSTLKEKSRVSKRGNRPKRPASFRVRI